jgi:phosphoribosylformylglycinamidine (FGAM) synthase-like enzyme
MNTPRETLDELALDETEYELVVQKLGREPNGVELGMFGSLWSEHCGYKHSKPLLKLLPSGGKNVLVNPGEENAGVVDIGDGQAAVMKIESHNHPSAVDPYQGAATATGGVVRDILTMGARPVALLNSLRFGPLTESNSRY